jgi:tryptophan synthase alpha chain
MSESRTNAAARIDDVFRSLRAKGGVGIMTHIVLGYPSVDESRRIVDVMVRAGVDLIEVQIPFSDPTADGPVITEASQAALDAGVCVADAMEFMKDVSSRYTTPFLFMTYVNIGFGYRGGSAPDGGLRAFVRDAAAAGVGGLILPDLPPDMREEGYVEACREYGVHPIWVVSPNAPDRRLDLIRDVASGFVYSTSRTGTTGKEMDLAWSDLTKFLARARERLRLPIAVGFSVSKREEIEALRGHADMAVVGSHLIRVFRRGGLGALEAELAVLTGVR